MYQRPDAPQTMGQVLDGGLQLFRASINDVFLLAFVGAVVGQVPQILGLEMTPDAPLPQITGQIGFALVGALIIGLVLYGAIVARIHAIATGAKLSTSESLQLGLAKGPTVFVAGIIFFFAVVLGFSALIIPGVIVAITFMFCFYAIIVNNMGPLQSLSYSKQLVWQQWWRTVGLLAIMFSGLIVLLSGIRLIAGVVGAATSTTIDPSTLPWYVNLLVLPLISAVITPLFYAFGLALFYDLEARRSSGTAE